MCYTYSCMRVDILLWPRTELNLDSSEGANRVALYELEYLNKYNVNTRLFAKKVNREFPNIYTVKQHKILGDTYFPYYTQFVLKNFKSDLLFGINCPKLAFFLPKKTVINFLINNPWLPYYNKKHLRERYKQSHFVFCSNFSKEYFLQKYPEIPEDKCFVCYPGIDTSIFRPQYTKKEKMETSILFLGQWIEEKGIYVLLKAIKLLEKRRNDFRLTLGGGPYLWKLKFLLSRQQETENRVYSIIQCLKNVDVIGMVENVKIPQLYNSADILILPSIDSEAFGMVGIEAMACEVPVVASRVGGIPEHVINNKTGILVEPNNEKLLADAIEYLIDNKSTRKKLGKTGRKRVENHFTWDAHTKTLIKIFEHVKKAE